jgi:cytochrome c5
MRKILLISAAVSLGVAAVQVHADGAAVYNSGCMACHASGVAGAPKVGDKEAWTDRIAQGAELLYEHAIVGYQGKNGG